MKDFLKNIFNPETPRTNYCTVVRRTTTTKYEVSDRIGRVSYVVSTDFYPAGTTVVVKDGRIIGRGALAGTHRVYEV